MSEYKIVGDSKYPSAYSAKVEDIYLNESDTRRTVLRAEIVDNPKDSGPIRISLLHQKKSKKDEWVDDREFDMKNVKNGELVKWRLSCSQTQALFEHLFKLYKAAKSKGVLKGENTLVVENKENVVLCDENKANLFNQLLEKGYAEEFWNMLSEDAPEIATKITLGHLQAERKRVIEEFKENVKDQTKKENFWQDFFEKNKWIFGYGLRYQILRQEASQPRYGGQKLDGKGEQKGDYLCSTEGDIGFTVLVEIKSPFTGLTAGTKAHRSGAWSLSPDLTDGVAQLQANIEKWQEYGSKNPDNVDLLEKKEVYTVSPKGILLIGRLELIAGNRDKRGTFERFRQSVNGIEILTFDELLRRAEFIVNHEIDSGQDIQKDIDLPF